MRSSAAPSGFHERRSRPHLLRDLDSARRGYRPMGVSIEHDGGNKPLHEVRIGEAEVLVARSCGGYHRIHVRRREAELLESSPEYQSALFLAGALERPNLGCTTLHGGIERFVTVRAHDYRGGHTGVRQSVNSADERIDSAHILMMHFSGRTRLSEGIGLVD